MMLEDLLESGSIAPQVSATTKRQALSVVAEIAARNFGLKAPRLFDALLEREALGPTGIGHGVAVPHCPIEGLDRTRGVFLRLQAPVDFGAVDDEPVDLIFALFSPPSGGSEHLRALARVSRIFRNPRTREQLRNSRSADAILALFVQQAQPSAA
jgi:nitrogen PTS system EIIA component